MDAPTSPETKPEALRHAAPIGFAEFVALIASLMALGALGIDSMLPALPAIARSLGVGAANAQQFVITAYVAGFGLAQLVHGPLSDRFGRRRTLLVSVSLYIIANILCAAAGSFTLLLAARAFGGAAIAATRVSVVAMVRDCYTGRSMARVMSIAFIVFMIVPVLAPTFGATVLLFGNWRAIFATIAGVATGVLLWFAIRMPETLHADDRSPILPARIAAGWRLALADRWSLGYTIGSTALLGALYGYLNSIQQVMADVFHRPALLVLIFATTAAAMALANLFNARLVMRLGTRLISHGAVCVLIVAAGLHLLLTLGGMETLLVFGIMQAITLGCFGLATANFSAMAMENMGHIAGTASSVQGFTSATIGALIGAVIGQAFNGTTVPLSSGFLLAGIAALAAAAITERGRLFRPIAAP